jgi:hypothetical protein
MPAPGGLAVVVVVATRISTDRPLGDRVTLVAVPGISVQVADTGRIWVCAIVIIPSQK